MIHFVINCQADKDPMVELVKQDIPYLFTYRDEIPIWQALAAKFVGVTVVYMQCFTFQMFALTLKFINNVMKY